MRCSGHCVIVASSSEKFSSLAERSPCATKHTMTMSSASSGSMSRVTTFLAWAQATDFKSAKERPAFVFDAVEAIVGKLEVIVEDATVGETFVGELEAISE